jgi:hypothetical protein
MKAHFASADAFEACLIGMGGDDGSGTILLRLTRFRIAVVGQNDGRGRCFYGLIRD